MEQTQENLVSLLLFLPCPGTSQARLPSLFTAPRTPSPVPAPHPSHPLISQAPALTPAGAEPCAAGQAAAPG